MASNIPTLLRHSAVAAIDFGTTFSCYAFAFRDKPKLEDISINKDWGGELGITLEKTPTTVLVDKHMKFKSFGYTAEREYAQLCNSEQGKDFHLFRHFKMMLYKQQNINRESLLQALDGKKYKAILIFSMAIKYLKEHFLKDVTRQFKSIENDDISWVLTIPAIWNDQAKQFMREAAYNAGLIPTRDSDQLILALEPEAASICCRNLKENFFVEPLDPVKEIFPVGTKYMIIDAGGGTVDITAHVIKEDGNMMELVCPSGGDWGGIRVDDNFEQLLGSLLSKDFIENLKQDYPSQWLELMTKFEVKKGASLKGDNADLSIEIPFFVSSKFKELKGKEIDHNIKRASSKGVSFSHGHLRLHISKAKSLFNPVVDKIVSHVSNCIKNGNLANLAYIILVGGFGGSEILFDKLKAKFSVKGTRVISPLKPNLSIVRGAVLFGLKPEYVSARIAKRTYGQWTSRLFQKGDKQKKAYLKGNEKRCKDVFHTIVMKGELVKIQSCNTITTFPPNDTDETTSAVFYATDSTKVKYTDDPGVTKIGSLTIKIPPIPGKSTLQRPIEQRLYFGRTEIQVELEDKSRKDGHLGRTSINFLNN